MKKKINALSRIVIPKEMIRELNWISDDYNEIDVIVKVHSDKELDELEKCVRIRRHYKDEDNILKGIENLIIKLVDFKEEKNIDDSEEISVDTPLGNALLNRQIIDEITYETNGNRVKASVIEKLN